MPLGSRGPKGKSQNAKILDEMFGKSKPKPKAKPKPAPKKPRAKKY